MSADRRQGDILIAGGGLVGASLALALARAGLRCTVVEAHPPRSEGQPSFDDRSTALSWSSRRILGSLDVWPRIVADATPIRTIHVSDRGRFGFTRLRAREEGVEALGYVVPNRALGPALWDALKVEKAVTVMTPARVSEVEEVRAGEDHRRVTIEVGDARRSVATPLLVVADGARSPLRERLGIATRRSDYDEVAIIANVSVTRPCQATAFERFTEDGPLALLPRGADLYGLVFTVDAADAEAVRALDDRVFLELLQSRFGWRLGRFRRVGERHAHPLELVVAREDAADRAVVLGNAAHSLHPIAGQGFNLGLRDVAALAETLAEAVRAGEDPGAPDVLARYSDWRRRDQRAVTLFTDGLARAFRNPLTPVRAARSVAMLALDLLPGAKGAFARYTMGRRGRQSRLARGLS